MSVARALFRTLRPHGARDCFYRVGQAFHPFELTPQAPTTHTILRRCAQAQARARARAIFILVKIFRPVKRKARLVLHCGADEAEAPIIRPRAARLGAAPARARERSAKLAGRYCWRASGRAEGRPFRPPAGLPLAFIDTGILRERRSAGGAIRRPRDFLPSRKGEARFASPQRDTSGSEAAEQYRPAGRFGYGGVERAASQRILADLLAKQQAGLIVEAEMNAAP
jgi:hypothetical protein